MLIKCKKTLILNSYAMKEYFIKNKYYLIVDEDNDKYHIVGEDQNVLHVAYLHKKYVFGSLEFKNYFYSISENRKLKLNKI